MNQLVKGVQYHIVRDGWWLIALELIRWVVFSFHFLGVAWNEHNERKVHKQPRWWVWERTGLGGKIW